MKRTEYDDAVDELLLVAEGAAVICGLLQGHPSDTALEAVRVALHKACDDVDDARNSARVS